LDGPSASEICGLLFWKIEDEDEENINKEQHSRLLITRLLILIAGYLLAVALKILSIK
jgi:hypothetical protein